VYGTRTSRPKSSECAVDSDRNLVGRGDALAPIAERGGRRALIAKLVVVIAPRLEIRQWRLGRNDEDGNAVGVRFGEGGGDIGQTGATDDDSDSRLAAGASIAIGHETRALLVTDSAVLNRRVAQRRIDWDRVVAGDAEDVPDTLPFQTADDRFTAAQEVRSGQRSGSFKGWLCGELLNHST
jgi:hypothetical protein